MHVDHGIVVNDYIDVDFSHVDADIDTVVDVPDRRRRILLKVVLVRHWVTWVLGIWRGEGGERVEKGEVSLQAT